MSRILVKILLIVLLALVLIPAGHAHVPAGYSFKITTQVGEYSVKLMVFPAKPEVNKSSEIIVGIINNKTNAPFKGDVQINGVPATQFSRGFYEVTYIFRETGNTTILFEFAGEDEKLETTLTTEVVDSPGPSKLLFGGGFIVLSIIFIIVWFLRDNKK